MLRGSDVMYEVVDYIRNSGEGVDDYNLRAIVDDLIVRYRLEGEESYRDIFEYEVYCGRVAQ